MANEKDKGQFGESTSNQSYRTDQGTPSQGAIEDVQISDTQVTLDNVTKIYCVRLEYDDDVKRIAADEAKIDQYGHLVLYRDGNEIAKFKSGVKDYWPE